MFDKKQAPRFYIATGLTNHVMHNALRDMLLALGHEISYDWTTHGPAWPKGIDYVRIVANDEFRGVVSADYTVVLLPGGRGTHVELGMAYTACSNLIIWADTDKAFQCDADTCAFYHLQDVHLVTGPLENVVERVQYLYPKDKYAVL